jgi:Glyoxalase-like domain
MTVKIASVTFDCADALNVARFWSAALDRPLDPDASSDFASIGFTGRRDTEGWTPVERDADPTWMFNKVPESKTAKNRMHLDVMAPDPEAEDGDDGEEDSLASCGLNGLDGEANRPAGA